MTNATFQAIVISLCDFTGEWPRPYREAGYNVIQVDLKHGGAWLAHGGRHAGDGDREKLNLAAQLGWRVLRYSPRMLADDPLGVVNQVVAALGLEEA